jgi:hypothetical protein
MEADRHVLEKRLAALSGDLDDERRGQAQTAAGESPDAEQAGGQTEHMRNQIAELQATVAELKQYETLYMAAKSRKAKAEAANGFTVEGGKAGGELVQMKQAGRA